MASECHLTSYKENHHEKRKWKWYFTFFKIIFCVFSKKYKISKIMNIENPLLLSLVSLLKIIAIIFNKSYLLHFGFNLNWYLFSVIRKGLLALASNEIYKECNLENVIYIKYGFVYEGDSLRQSEEWTMICRLIFLDWLVSMIFKSSYRLPFLILFFFRRAKMAQILSPAPAAVGDALSPKTTTENAMFATIKMENSICPSTVIPVLSTLIQWRRSLSTTSFQVQRSSL